MNPSKQDCGGKLTNIDGKNSQTGAFIKPVPAIEFIMKPFKWFGNKSARIDSSGVLR
jgi:hypothetical protein